MVTVLPAASVVINGFTTVSASASFSLKVLEMTLLTLTVDSRPWWHSIQRASAPRFVSVMPDGNFTLVLLAVPLLWQATQSIRLPAFAIGFSILPAVRDSRYPSEVWHLAQSVGTPPVGQWLKASALISEWPAFCQSARNGTTGDFSVVVRSRIAPTAGAGAGVAVTTFSTTFSTGFSTIFSTGFSTITVSLTVTGAGAG